MAGETGVAGVGVEPTARPGTLLAVASVGWFLVQGGRYLLPPLAPAITSTFHIGNAAFGLALSLLWAVYALTNFPGGIASDDLGFRTVLVGSLVVSGLGFVGLSLAGSYPVVLVLLAVVGSGVGFFLVGSRTFISALYGPQRGRAIGLHNAAGDVGGVFAPLVAIVVLAQGSWRLPFVVVGVGAVAVAGLLHARLAGPYVLRRPPVGRATRRAVAEIATPEVGAVLAVYGVYVLVVQGVASFIPLYLIQSKALDPATASLALSVFFLVGVVVKPVSGWASDRVGRQALTIGSLATAGVALGALVVASGSVGVFASVVAFAGLVKLFPAATQAYLFDQFSADASGSAFGLSRSAYVLVGSAGPALVGLGSETLGFDRTLTVLAAGLVVVALAFGGLVRSTRT